MKMGSVKSITALLRVGQYGGGGEYSVLGFCIVPRCARANTASLELNIPPYCPPTVELEDV